MAKPSPKQIVTDKFGTRADLIKAILSATGGGDDESRSLRGTTNKKLLRIHEVGTTVKSKFGGKKGLIDAMEGLQFAHTKTKKANEGWRDKMDKFTIKRLFDMHRQLTTKKTPNR